MSDVRVYGAFIGEAQDAQVVALSAKEVVALRYLRPQAIHGALVGVRIRNDA